MGASATILQVVINPYLTACRVKGTQAIQRLAIGGTANSVGTTIAPYFVTGVVSVAWLMENDPDQPVDDAFPGIDVDYCIGCIPADEAVFA